MGFSPDHKTLAVVSIGSNSVSFIDTATNAVKHITYVGRSPHEAFFTPDGNEVWVTVRGEDRSEEHTSELQSLMRISYAVFCLKKKKRHKNKINNKHTHTNTPTYKVRTDY